jgi:hypothetical protein
MGDGSPLDGVMDLTVVSTGYELIYWGGVRQAGSTLPPGAIYDARTDKWTAISDEDGPPATRSDAVAWVAPHLYVFPSTGARQLYRYDLLTKAWTTLASYGAPAASQGQRAVASAGSLVLFGGLGSEESTTGIYAPGLDSWQPIPDDCTPPRLSQHTLTNVGNGVLVWGGKSIDGVEVQDQGWVLRME